jgi:hypothetical protein
MIFEFLGDPIFEGFGPTLLKEKLEEYKGIVICKETMRQMMIEEGRYKARIKKKKKVHPERERRCQRGELVQIDGSYHPWLEGRGPKGCLLLFVDDATSEVLAAEFVDHESFFAYASLCKSYFRSTGLPVAFYSDRFSVFRANSKTSIQKDAITQFNRVLAGLSRPSKIVWSRSCAYKRSIHTRMPMLICLSLFNFTTASLQSCLALLVMSMPHSIPSSTWTFSSPSMTFALSQRTCRSNSTTLPTRSSPTDLHSISPVVRSWSPRMLLVLFPLTSTASYLPSLFFTSNPNLSKLFLPNPWIIPF